MVPGMTRTTKAAPAPTRKPRKTARAALVRLKKAWPAATALGLVAIVASAAVMSSAPAISASPVTAPSATAYPAPTPTHIPGTGPAPALGTPFLADAGEGNVALVTVAKGTYSEGTVRRLVLEVKWKQAGGVLTPDRSLLDVTTSTGKAAQFVSEEAAEKTPEDSLADKVFLYTYEVGPGDAEVTVAAKYAGKPTTFTIPS
jgi:hypothetical protein